MASLGSLIFYNLPVIQCQRTKKKVSHFSALNSVSLYIAIILSDKRNTFKDSIPCEVFHGSKKTKKKMWRFLIYFFPLLPVLNLETNKHVVLVLLGQKMALLRVNSGTLSLRPYPHLPFFFWKWRFFSLLSKQSVSTGCFFLFSDWKWHHLWWEQCMHFNFLLVSNTMT